MILPFTAAGKSARSRRAAKTYSRQTASEARKAARGHGITVLEGRSLRQRLREDPNKVAARCGGDAVCAAEVGRAVGATEVVLAQITSRGRGADLMLLVVEATSGEILRTAFVSVPSPQGARKRIRVEMPMMLGLVKAEDEVDPLASVDGVLGVETPVDLPDLPELPEDKAAPDPPPPPPPVAAATKPVPKEEAQPAAANEPVPGEANTGPAVESSPTSVEAVPHIEVASVPPRDPYPLTGPVVDDGGGTSAALITGFVALGLGVAGVGVGTYFGLEHEARRRGPDPGATQIAFDQQVKEANAMADYANISFIAAGAVGLTGVILTTIGIFAGDDDGPVVEVTAGPSSASVGLRATW